MAANAMGRNLCRTVIPAKAGIHELGCSMLQAAVFMDPGLRRDDELVERDHDLVGADDTQLPLDRFFDHVGVGAARIEEG